ncbi:hypothetical protein [Halalkalibacterium ligniniphilum]|uniref:hypothetical protein n=1 Tax=Halalkalibacterium ligniniphilum TaxID=1134413 RepID=UPI00034C267A|nr:hypothetical protein [Halalkalibacterium ligniniphilum]
MSRISRISSLRTDRMVVDQVTRSSAFQGFNPVEKSEAISISKNATSLPSDNFLLSYEHYYEKLQNLKSEPKTLNEKDNEHHEAAQALSTKEYELFKHTFDLIQKYNEAIFALLPFDRIAGTSYFEDIRTVYQSFSKQLSELGILETNEGFLELDVDRFVHYLSHAQAANLKQIGAFKKMVLKKYRSFMKVRLTKTSPLSAYEQHPLPVKGLLIEAHL